MSGISDDAVKAARDAAAEATNNGANVREVARILAQAHADIDAAEAAMEPYKADIRVARARVKGAGVTMAAFNVARRLRALEPEDRGDAIDQLRICVLALGLGQQGDLFAATGDAQTETAETRVH